MLAYHKESPKKASKILQPILGRPPDDLTVRKSSLWPQLIGCESFRISNPVLGGLDTIRTGTLTPMRWTPKFIKHLQFRITQLPSSKVPLILYLSPNRLLRKPDVLKVRHGLGLDEFRGIFPPTIMHIDDLSTRDMKQVLLSGSHSNKGRMKPNGIGLGNIALRRMIKELSS